MSNTHALFRTLLIYSVCLPLAIYVGYLLATPDTLDTVGTVGLLLFILLIPVLLRHHHLLLVISWNMAAVVPLLSGSPQLWLVMALLSLGFSVFNRALRKQNRFLPALPIIFPLIFLLAVILITGHLTGGIGFRSAGGDTYGGKRYLLLIGAIIGFFALVAQRVPEKLGERYLAMFLLAEVTSIFSSILAVAGPPWTYGIAIFSADPTSLELADNTHAFVPFGGVFRLMPIATAGQALFFFMLARYGARGILDLRKWWRLLLATGFMVMSLFGGFRSSLILMFATFAFLFWVEGLWRTRFLPALLCALVLIGALVVPLANRMPMAIQRTLSFLPIDIDPVVRVDAEYSSEWRIHMWKILIEEIPQYLILGKGFAISRQDVELAQNGTGRVFDTSEMAILAGDYHNGPLSVILPLGIFGLLGFLWFLGAGIWVLKRNYSHGGEELKRANAFLLAAFIAKTVFFFVIYGSFYAELYKFTGMLGMSICLNGGIRRPVLTQPLFIFKKARPPELNRETANG